MKIVGAVLVALGLFSVAEARDFGLEGHLRDCTADDRYDCASNREQLRREWPKALAGDHSSQRNVAFCLSSGCGGALKVDKIEGCAWQIVILASGNPGVDATSNMNFRVFCGSEYGFGDISPARSVAGELFSRIYRRSLPPPPWEWVKPVDRLALAADPLDTLRKMTSAMVMAERCPGAAVDKSRMFAISKRLGVLPADIAVGGRYHQAMVEHGSTVKALGSMAPQDQAKSCKSLGDMYGRAGQVIPGLAIVPPRPTYPN